MRVWRVATPIPVEHGTLDRLEVFPAFNPRWSKLEKLQYALALALYDADLDQDSIRIEKSGRRGYLISAESPSSSASRHAPDFDAAAYMIAGIELGAWHAKATR